MDIIYHFSQVGILDKARAQSWLYRNKMTWNSQLQVFQLNPGYNFQIISAMMTGAHQCWHVQSPHEIEKCCRENDKQNQIVVALAFAIHNMMALLSTHGEPKPMTEAEHVEKFVKVVDDDADDDDETNDEADGVVLKDAETPRFAPPGFGFAR